MSNLFSSPALLQTVAATIFDAHDTEVAVVDVEGSRFRVLLVDGRVTDDVPILDFYEPLPGDEPARFELKHLPAVALQHTSIDAQADERATSACGVAPYVSWGRFPDFEAYRTWTRSRSSQSFYRNGRTERKLAASMGQLSLETAADHQALETCIGWKAAQYQRSRYVDLFSSPRYRRCFHALLDAGLVQLTTLRAGGTLVAGSVEALADGRRYEWITAYDHALRGLAPGVVLREKRLAECFALGDAEYDFLIGAEEYKFRYATHVRLVRGLGTPAWHERLWDGVRPHLLAPVRRVPALHRGLQDIKRHMRLRRL